MNVGDPADPDTSLGALISHGHRDKVESFVALAEEEGGTIETGGVRPDVTRSAGMRVLFASYSDFLV